MPFYPVFLRKNPFKSEALHLQEQDPPNVINKLIRHSLCPAGARIAEKVLIDKRISLEYQ